nr:hypothetical protein [Mesorhizobium sp.]
MNAYGLGARARAQTDSDRLEAETLVNFIRIGWGRDNPAFCQFFTNLFIPDGKPEQHRWWGDLERETATAEVAAQLLWQMQGIDVMDLAAALRVPTLIAHSRGDMRVPFGEGCRLAATIPGARFVPLESKNHVLLPDEPAWPVFYSELGRFLGQDRAAQPGAVRDAGLTPAETVILNLVAEGLDNRSIAERLGKSKDGPQPVVGDLQQAGRAQPLTGDRQVAVPLDRLTCARCGTDVPRRMPDFGGREGQLPHASRQTWPHPRTDQRGMLLEARRNRHDTG